MAEMQRTRPSTTTTTRQTPRVEARVPSAPDEALQNLARLRRRAGSSSSSIDREIEALDRSDLADLQWDVSHLSAPALRPTVGSKKVVLPPPSPTVAAAAAVVVGLNEPAATTMTTTGDRPSAAPRSVGDDGSASPTILKIPPEKKTSRRTPSHTPDLDRCVGCGQTLTSPARERDVITFSRCGHQMHLECRERARIKHHLATCAGCPSPTRPLPPSTTLTQVATLSRIQARSRIIDTGDDVRLGLYSHTLLNRYLDESRQRQVPIDNFETICRAFEGSSDDDDPEAWAHQPSKRHLFQDYTLDESDQDYQTLISVYARSLAVERHQSRRVSEFRQRLRQSSSSAQSIASRPPPHPTIFHSSDEEIDDDVLDDRSDDDDDVDQTNGLYSTASADRRSSASLIDRVKGMFGAALTGRGSTAAADDYYTSSEGDEDDGDRGGYERSGRGASNIDAQAQRRRQRQRELKAKIQDGEDRLRRWRRRARRDGRGGDSHRNIDRLARRIESWQQELDQLARSWDNYRTDHMVAGDRLKRQFEKSRRQRTQETVVVGMDEPSPTTIALIGRDLTKGQSDSGGGGGVHALGTISDRRLALMRTSYAWDVKRSVETSFCSRSSPTNTDGNWVEQNATLTDRAVGLLESSSSSSMYPDSLAVRSTIDEIYQVIGATDEGRSSTASTGGVIGGEASTIAKMMNIAGASRADLARRGYVERVLARRHYVYRLLFGVNSRQLARALKVDVVALIRRFGLRGVDVVRGGLTIDEMVAGGYDVRDMYRLGLSWTCLVRMGLAERHLVLRRDVFPVRVLVQTTDGYGLSYRHLLQALSAHLSVDRALQTAEEHLMRRQEQRASSSSLTHYHLVTTPMRTHTMLQSFCRIGYDVHELNLLGIDDLRLMESIGMSRVNLIELLTNRYDDDDDDDGDGTPAQHRQTNNISIDQAVDQLGLDDHLVLHYQMDDNFCYRVGWDPNVLADRFPRASASLGGRNRRRHLDPSRSRDARSPTSDHSDVAIVRRANRTRKGAASATSDPESQTTRRHRRRRLDRGAVASSSSSWSDQGVGGGRGRSVGRAANRRPMRRRTRRTSDRHRGGYSSSSPSPAISSSVTDEAIDLLLSGQ